MYDLYPEDILLANIRNDNNWNKTKNIAKQMGSFSLETLKDVASNVISDLITEISSNWVSPNSITKIILFLVSSDTFRSFGFHIHKLLLV